MSAKPETTFIASVHKHLPPGRRDPYYFKNNNEYTAGIPDVWYSGQKNDLWVEYKFLDKIPIKKEFKPALSELQNIWLDERYAEGRNVAVIIGCKEGGVILMGGQWNVPMSNATFKIWVRSRKEIAEWIMEQTVK